MIEPAWPQALNSTEPWDVVVLGAGPAGALAARQLSLAGRRVLLVEKHRLPRPKVCGGCLGGAALNVLNRVGLAHVPRQCGGVRLGAMRLANGGQVVEFPAGRRIAVSRERFDYALTCEAQRAGASVCYEAVGELIEPNGSRVRSVRLIRPGQGVVVHAKAVLVATGLGSVGRELKSRCARNSFIGVSALVEQPLSHSQRSTLQMACSRVGYVGMAAVGENVLDVAAAVSPKALARARSTSDLLERIVCEAGLESPSDLGSVQWRGTPPLTRQVQPLVLDRAVLIGDAAGYVEPFTGEGIGWAMQSAIEAASLVHEQLRSWNANAVAHWARRYEAAVRRRHRRCRAVTRALRSDATRSIAMWALDKLPALASPVVHGLDRPLASFTAPMELFNGR